MRTLAILPIKSFHDAKQRLRDELSPAPRRALVEAMFTDVLVALGRSSLAGSVLVVSGDNVGGQVAAGYGATVIGDDQQGHNHAAARGITRALELKAERVLLVPGDCPLLDPAELDALVDRPAAPGSVVVVPDRHGTGTNALLLCPPDCLPPAFGPGSRERHLQAAQAAGLEAEVVELDTLALDVDTPEDLTVIRQALADRHGGAAHTRGLLAQLTRTANSR
jgi:2-phospho-L-lactate guanylyltransferase